MRHSRRVWMLFSMLFGLEGILGAQAMVEHALGAGRAATTTAPARGVGKAVSGVMGSLDKVLKTGKDASGSPPPAETRGTARPGAKQLATLAPPDAVPAVPAKVYEDPTGIQAGMANEELIRRFGPPALERSEERRVRRDRQDDLPIVKVVQG